MIQEVGTMNTAEVGTAWPQRLRSLLLLVLLLACGSAMAVDPRVAQDSRQAFKSFAMPLIGSWDCNLRTWDDRFHEKMVETVQKRRFEWILKGNFLQESVYAVLRGGDTVHVGLNLLSVDPETTHILSSGFDVNAPDRSLTLDAELAPDLRHLTGKVQVTPKNDAIQPERLDWQWIDEGRIRSRLYSRASNGREFLNKELICKRASDTAATADQ